MECGFCGETLPAPPFQGGELEVPCRCGYLNLVEQQEIEMPIGAIVDHLVPGRRELAADTDDPAACRNACTELFRIVLAKAHAVVEDDPEGAEHAVWHYLQHFEDVSKQYRRGNAELGMMMVPAIARALQLLVASLHALGRSPVAAPRDSGPAARLVPLHSAIAGDAFPLAGMVDNLRNGMFEGRIRGGVMIVRKTLRHTRMREWLLNRVVLERRSPWKPSRDEIFSGPSHEAQSVLLGVSPDILHGLFADRLAALRQLAAASADTVFYIRPGDCPDDVHTLFDALLLTPERLRAFSEPFYWDLGTPDQTADGSEVLFRAGRLNWLNYYPLVPGRDERGGEGYLLAAEAVTYCAGNLEEFKGRLLERVYAKVKAGGASKPVVDRVAKLRSQANRAFERTAARVAEQTGFATAVSIQAAGGIALPGGEIDLLAAAAGADGKLVIVVGEVKDFDVTLHRAHGAVSLKRKVDDAERQLAGKAADVRRLWRPLVEQSWPGRFLDVRQAVIVAVLITSDLLPATTYGSYPAVALLALPAFLEMLGEDLDRFPRRYGEAVSVTE